MNSVYNILIKKVSAATSPTYDGSKEREWGQKVLNFGSGTGSSAKTLTSVLVSTINWVLAVAAIVSVIFLVIGGIKYITSEGNKDKTLAATTTLKNALIALVGIFILGSLLTVLTTLIG